MLKEDILCILHPNPLIDQKVFQSWTMTHIHLPVSNSRVCTIHLVHSHPSLFDLSLHARLDNPLPPTPASCLTRTLIPYHPLAPILISHHPHPFFSSLTVLNLIALLNRLAYHTHQPLHPVPTPFITYRPHPPSYPTYNAGSAS